MVTFPLPGLTLHPVGRGPRSSVLVLVIDETSSLRKRQPQIVDLNGGIRPAPDGAGRAATTAAPLQTCRARKSFRKSRLFGFIGIGCRRREGQIIRPLKWGFHSPVAGETLSSETDLASLLNIGPVYIRPLAKGALSPSRAWFDAALTSPVRPATTVAGKAVLTRNAI
jgi:hypothetical protein